MTTMTIDTTMFESLHKQEAWKYTNVSAIAKIDFASTGSEVSASVCALQKNAQIKMLTPLALFTAEYYRVEEFCSKIGHTTLTRGHAVEMSQTQNLAF